MLFSLSSGESSKAWPQGDSWKCGTPVQQREHYQQLFEKVEFQLASQLATSVPSNGKSMSGNLPSTTEVRQWCPVLTTTHDSSCVGSRSACSADTLTDTSRSKSPPPVSRAVIKFTEPPPNQPAISTRPVMSAGPHRSLTSRTQHARGICRSRSAISCQTSAEERPG